MVRNASCTVAMDSPQSDPHRNNHKPESNSVDRGTPSPTETENFIIASVIDPASASTAMSLNRTRERWWTSIAVIGISLLIFIAATVMMTIIAVFYVHGSISGSIFANPSAMRETMRSPAGLFLLIVAPQLALVTPCLLAAHFSPEPTLKRLALVRGNWPVWAWFTAALATPLIGMLSGVVIGIFLEERETLREMSDVFRQQGESGFTAQLILMVALTPAFARSCFSRLRPKSLDQVFLGFGISLASLTFAAFHMDPVHVIAVAPIGFFLGWLSWQSGSLFPAILAHFGNNLVAVFATIMAPAADSGTLSLPVLEFTLGILLLGVIGIAGTVAASIMYKSPRLTVSESDIQPV